MQNCILFEGATIEFALFSLGDIAMGGSVAGYNVINGQPNFYNIPTSSVGLSAGTIWANSNVLTLVP